MAARKKKDGLAAVQAAIDLEIRQLVRRREAEVAKVVRDFRRLGPGRRRERGPLAAYFASVLEEALRDARRERRRAERR